MKFSIEQSRLFSYAAVEIFETIFAIIDDDDYSLLSVGHAEIAYRDTASPSPALWHYHFVARRRWRRAAMSLRFRQHRQQRECRLP